MAKTIINEVLIHQGSGSGLDADTVDGVDLPATIASTLSDHNKANHDSLAINAGSVDGVSLPGTIASVLTNHNKANHDSLAINADTLDGYHAEDIIFYTM